MKKVFLLIIVLFTISTFHGEELSKTIGVIGNAELSFNNYKADPKAEAVIMFDIGQSSFELDEYDNYIYILHKRSTRIKILKDGGIKYAEISIPYYVDKIDNSETIYDIVATSYNYEDGKMTKKSINVKDIFEEKYSEHIYLKRFAIPNTKAGSIIEYSYTLKTPRIGLLPDWEFQNDIPTIYSEYTVMMIPLYEYSFFAQGLDKFDFQESKLGREKKEMGNVGHFLGKKVGSGIEFKEMVHTYAMKNVPAFRDESFITSKEDYIMKIDFQLAKTFDTKTGLSTNFLTTWPELINEFLKDKDFGKYIKKSSKLGARLLSELPDFSDFSDEMKAKVIIEYVRNNFSWNDYNSKMANKTPSEFISHKNGNAAEINLFLTGMLQAAGIDAHPVLISTRSHGKIRSDYPYQQSFNYVLVVVNTADGSFITDGTVKNIAYNRIPPRCINNKGLCMKKGDISWVNLELDPQSYDLKTMTINIHADSPTADINIFTQATEYEAYVYRNRYNNDSIEIKNFLKESGFKTATNFKSRNFTNTNQPYIFSCDGSMELEVIDDQIILQPFLKFPMQENQLKQRRRTYPVDLIYPRNNAFHTIVNIPPNYKLTSLPEKFEKVNSMVEIKLEYFPTENGFEVKANYDLKKAIYNAYEYPRLKNYFNTIIEKFNEAVVLEKVKE